MRASFRTSAVAISLAGAVALTGCSEAPEAPEGLDPSFQVVAPPGAGPPTLVVGLPQTSMTPTQGLQDALATNPGDVGFSQLLEGLVLARAPANTDLRLYAARVEDGGVAAEALSGPVASQQVAGESLDGFGLNAPGNMMPDGFVPGKTFLPGEEIVPDGDAGQGQDVPVFARAGGLIPPAARNAHGALQKAGGWPVVGIIDGILIVDGIWEPRGPGGLQRAAREHPYIVLTVFPDGAAGGSGGGSMPGVFPVFATGNL